MEFNAVVEQFRVTGVEQRPSDLPARLALAAAGAHGRTQPAEQSRHADDHGQRHLS